MEKGEPIKSSPADRDFQLPAVGTVIDVCGGEEGINKTFKSMLSKTLLWADSQYSPLGVPQRLLPSPLLSDTEGLKLMRAIIRLPTYYQTDGEVEHFEAFGLEIAKSVPENAVLIDLGCGDVRKIKPLLDWLEYLENRVWYFALDLSREELQRGMQMLMPQFKHVKCYGLWGTFDDGLSWLNAQPVDRPRYFMSLGSIFGNDHFKDAVRRLNTWKNAGFRGEQDSMLLTMDATSDTKAIWESYHDSEGLFERFIRNGYKNSNHILAHDWYRDEDWDLEGIMQEDPLMHRFVIRAKKEVKCPSLGLELPPGSEIDCYEAFKYSPGVMGKEFAESGFDVVACWKTPRTQICEYKPRNQARLHSNVGRFGHLIRSISSRPLQHQVQIVVHSFCNEHSTIHYTDYELKDNLSHSREEVRIAHLMLFIHIALGTLLNRYHG